MGTESYTYTYYDSYRFDKRPMDVIQKEKLLRRLSPFVWSKTQDVISELRGMLEGYTDYQRLCLLYRMVTENVKYDHSFKASAYTYLAVLQRRVGVCNGIASLLFLLCGECLDNTRCYHIHGNIGFDPEKHGHAWNMIELDTPGGRNIYFMDATWDLGGKKWDWFLVGDEKMRKGRIWESDRIPVAREQDYRGKVFKDEKKSAELSAWITRLGSRFDGSLYHLAKDKKTVG